MKENIESKTELLEGIHHKGFLLDLIIYITVMFLVREIYMPKMGFIANGLFWSITTLVVATWRMRIRGVSWKDLGLHKPTYFGKTVGISILILATIMISIITFEIIKDHLPFF